ncbi:hypothetical protein JB92DRAFT_2833594 [Gautieria morchelliformis]|nr:hypothetical protein JB92DRAFT_2833594 [Gautieria morchelliformis]
MTHNLAKVCKTLANFNPEGGLREKAQLQEHLFGEHDAEVGSHSSKKTAISKLWTKALWDNADAERNSWTRLTMSTLHRQAALFPREIQLRLRISLMSQIFDAKSDVPVIIITWSQTTAWGE